MCVWRHPAKLCWKRLLQHYIFSWKLELTSNLSVFHLFPLQGSIFYQNISITSNSFCETQYLSAIKGPFLSYNQKHKREGISLFNMMVTIWNPSKIKTNQRKMFDSNFQMLSSIYIFHMWYSCPYVHDDVVILKTLLSIGKTLRYKGTKATEEKNRVFWW